MPGWSAVLQLVLSALLLPSIVFLTAPVSIVTGNQEEITFYRADFHVVWILFAVSSAAIAGLLIALKAGGRALALQLLAALAINIVIWNSAFPYLWVATLWQLGLLVLVEVSLLFFTFWILRRLPITFLMRMTAIFAALNVAVAVYENDALASKLPEKKAVASFHPPAKPVEAHPDTAARFKGNVYHIVLDAFPREYLTYRLNNGDDLGLDGYTFYENAITSYGRTNVSMRAVFRGSLHWADFKEWGEKAFTDGFTKDLSENGVQQYFFPIYNTFCNKSVVVCNATQNLYPIYKKDIGRALVVDLVFAKALPVSVRDVMIGSLGTEMRTSDTWDYGFSLTSWWRSLIEGGGDYPTWKRPVQSLTMNTLAEFIEMEPTLSDDGRYVFLHMMVPHGPIIFDPDCNFVRPDIQAKKDSRKAAEEHASCALNVIGQINELLKRLDRFDDSTIIVHSDHGMGFPQFCAEWDSEFRFDPSLKAVSRSDFDPNTIPGQQVRSIANALLLVKAPRQSDFHVSSEPLQMIDIAPTVLDHFGLPHANLPGVSAISGSPAPERETVFFESETYNLPEIHYFSKYQPQDGEWRFQTRIPVGEGALDLKLSQPD